MMNEYFKPTDYMAVNNKSVLFSPVTLKLLSCIPVMNSEIFQSEFVSKEVDYQRLGLSDELRLPLGARHDLFTTRKYHGVQDFAMDRFKKFGKTDRERNDDTPVELSKSQLKKLKREQNARDKVNLFLEEQDKQRRIEERE